MIIMWLLANLASAQMAGELKGLGEFKGKKGPVHITSQRLEAEYEKRLITFIGDVVARQEDFVLYADRLILFLNDKGEGIEKIVAQGKVRLVQGNRKATSHEATYYHEEGTVVLQGEPEVREGDNWVRGKRIIYYINEQKSVAEGEGAQRVTITIIPREAKK
ncbi:MAG: lipopolysaccharide transport periplasmic protein LptA [Deltaproteobacteria bacterium RBG_13_52_11]|nr:MAG: lipopolysaccharide transport periplasmic protein LptA [Deltaproteobacteria bacterium RBG_13_52_11]